LAKRKVTNDAKTDQEKQDTKDKHAQTMKAKTPQQKQYTKQKQTNTVAKQTKADKQAIKQKYKESRAETMSLKTKFLHKSGASVTCTRTINPNYRSEVPAGPSGEVTEDQGGQFAHVNVKWAMGSGIFLEIPSPATFIYSGHYTSVAEAKAARTAANKKAKKANKE
jgi:hypothetical protein